MSFSCVNSFCDVFDRLKKPKHFRLKKT